jgi:hypothetical protein
MIPANPLTMTPGQGRDVPPPDAPQEDDVLISDEPTMELLVRAREGDRVAVEALLERCIP